MKKKLVSLAVVIVLLGALPHAANALWTQTNGLYGSFILALAVDGNNLFAGGNLGGAYRSSNDGESWISVNSGLPPPANNSVHSFALDGNSILAGTDSGVYRSDNNGTSWTAVNSGLPENSIVESLAASDGNIFAGTIVFGVYRSDNNGTSWTAVDSGLPYPAVYSIAKSGGNIFIGTQYSVFRSSNNGISWTSTDSGLPVNLVTFYPSGYTYNLSYVWSLAVSGSNLFAGTFNGVYLSTNNGASWVAVNSGLPAKVAVHSLVVSNDCIFAGTADSGSIFLSTNNGTSWTTVNTGLPANVTVYSLAIHNGTIFAGTNGYGIWKRPVSEMVGVIDRSPKRSTPNQIDLSLHSSSQNNHNVTIDFYLPYSSSVSIRMYNLSGNEIESITDTYFESGFHTVKWNTLTFPDGFYLLKLIAGSKRVVKNMPVFR